MVPEVREWLHGLRQDDRGALMAISDALTEYLKDVTV
jgi:hypothetical protein